MIQKQRGFTIIELMTTIAILAVVAAIAVPSIGNLMRKNRLTASANELFASVTIARSEAIKRKADVTIQATGASWSDGWTVTEGGDVLQTSTGSQGSITSSTFASKGAITFEANGYTSVASPWVNGDGVKFCDGEGKAKLVVVKTSGSVEVQDSTC